MAEPIEIPWMINMSSEMYQEGKAQLSLSKWDIEFSFFSKNFPMKNSVVVENVLKA